MRRRSIWPTLVVLACLLFWEFIPRSGNTVVFFPPFSDVALAMGNGIADCTLLFHAGASIWRALLGIACACLLAIPIGVVLGRYQRVYQLVEPIVEFFRPMPSAAVIPVAILFLGIGPGMKVFVVSFGATWPLLVSTIYAVRDTDPILIKTSKTFRLTATEELFSVVLPASLGAILSGFRISVAISLILTVTVEMIAGNDGLGYLILDAERSFAFPLMYAGIVTVGIVGVCISLLVKWLERRLLPGGSIQ